MQTFHKYVLTMFQNLLLACADKVLRGLGFAFYNQLIKNAEIYIKI